ncbi:MAG: murein biosynthesis integral membrane protein MurJ [Deltaproteobacteria bacterium]|nr:murein biosynthesis integral membrane protein MurJ [Deltaproteobacteria bacterium]
MRPEHHQISRRTGTVGFFTLVSRLFGLLRDASLAFAFGATGMADAFYVAFRIPNLLRRLVGEGALTVAFVPVYTETLKKSRDDARKAFSVVFTVLVIALATLVIMGVVFAPWFVRLLAYGFEVGSEKFNLTVFLTRVMFPYIFLISLVALTMGVLNACKRFAAPAASPILLNLAIIGGALFLAPRMEIPALAPCIAVLVGGVLQLLLQLPTLRREGMLPQWNVDVRHPALTQLGLMMIPAAYGAAVYQLNVMVITLLASFLPDGSVSYLWYADRVCEFPLGVFAIAVATATLPTLSDHAAEGAMVSFKETVNYGLRLNFAITVPAAVGLFLLAEPIVALLFQRGAFGPEATVATAAALKCFAFQIPLVAAIRNLVPAFYALKDARRPVVIATVALIVNAAVALILMHPFKHVGLASAMTISSATNMLLLFFSFRKKVGIMGGRRLVSSFVRMSLASLVMGVAVAIAVHSAINLFAIIGGAIIIYTVVLRFMAYPEYRAVMGVLQRKAL